MQGKIIKGIAGFYYVYAEDGNTYECRAKGIFRKDKRKPLVGDNVDITVLDEKELEGSVTGIHKRRNSLIRPAVANVDQALVIFAMDNPKPNFMLLDRFLIMMEREDVPAVICFNKKDLATAEELEFLYETYQSCGYQVILSSALKGEGLGEIEAVLKGKTTVVGSWKVFSYQFSSGRSGDGDRRDQPQTETRKTYHTPRTDHTGFTGYFSCGYTGIFLLIY